MLSFCDYFSEVELVHFLHGYLGVDCFLEGSSCVFACLRQDDPPSAGMFDHELGDIVDVVVDYYPAVSDLGVGSDFVPGIFGGHLTLSVIDN